MPPCLTKTEDTSFSMLNDFSSQNVCIGQNTVASRDIKIWNKSRDVSTNWINAYFRFLLHLKRQKMKLLKEKKTSLTVWSPWPQMTSTTLKTIHQWDKSLILWNIWFKKTKTFTKKFYPSYKITLSERKVKSDEDLWSLRNL